MSGHRIAGGIAHDLNNLLTVILCNVEFILLETEDGNPMRNELLGIDNAAQIASRLATQLLLVNRAAAREPALNDLRDVVNDAFSMVRRIVGDRIELVVKLDQEVQPVRIVADQIHRVLLNLAINARDAMPNGGHLIFEIRNWALDEQAVNELGDIAEFGQVPHAQAYVRLSVTDTGMGMDDEVQERAFEPRFSRKQEGSGAGLGLSVVYDIVRKHGGFITLQSKRGNGTTFDIYLPAAVNAA